MPPRQEKLHALLADQLLALEEAKHLVSEQLLGGVRSYVGDRDEAIVAGPAAPGHEGVDVRVWIDAVAEGLDDRDHAGSQIGLFDGGAHELADGLPGEAGQATP